MKKSHPKNDTSNSTSYLLSRQEVWITKDDLDVEVAETENVNAIDRRHSKEREMNQKQRQAFASTGTISAGRPSIQTTNNFQSRSKRFQDLARRARQMSKRHITNSSGTSVDDAVESNDLLEQIQSRPKLPSPRTTTTTFRSDTIGTEPRMQRYKNCHIPLYESLRIINSKSTDEDDDDNKKDVDDDNHGKNDYKIKEENSETNEGDDDYDEHLPLNQTSYGSVVFDKLRRSIKKKRSWKHRMNVTFHSLIGCNCQSFAYFLTNTVLCSMVVLVAFPMFILSFIFYYGFNNPVFPLFQEFFGTEITFSWWLNFLGRQILLLELARITERFVLDFCILGNTTFIGSNNSSNNGNDNTIESDRDGFSRNKRKNRLRLVGPYITLMAIHARGFPFVIWMWAVYDLFLLRGGSEFHNHWLYWIGWKIYEQGTSGKDILTSVLYLRLLIAMMVVGCATTAKRTIVALVFGKSLLADFKPRMEILLADIVLMNEISILAEQIDALAAEDQYASIDATDSTDKKQSSDSEDTETRSTFLSTSPSRTAPSSPVTNLRHDSGGIANENIVWSDIKPGMIARGESTAMHDVSDSEQRHQRRHGIENTLNKENDNPSHVPYRESLLKHKSSGGLALKDLLDPWEDPVVAMKNKNQDSSIEDVLKFKRALSYMDESHPFGDAFGPARDRDEALASAHQVYWQLMKFEMSCSSNVNNRTPSSLVLNFDVLALIANDDNGHPIQAKLNALKKLFRPDARNELPMLAFIQSCDNIYKRLRFFRASVSNSSAIDKVLEGMINWLFWLILSMFVMEIMDFDPWALIVSATSLLVSVSFALGSSVSQFVEGMLMIAVRRPFDLGDRIVIIGPESQEKPATNESYYVEEISLLKTTLRYARTNEVSTLNNFSISKSRIVNLQRSSSAIVCVEMKFKTSIFKNDDHLKFRSKLVHYIEENTRVWECLVFMRYDEFDPDWGNCLIRFAFRHRYSWQNAARIQLHRAELVRFMHDTGIEMNIFWQTPIPMRKILDGGIIDENDVIAPRTNGCKQQFFNDRGIDSMVE